MLPSSFPTKVREMVLELADKIPAAAKGVLDEIADQGMRHPILQRLSKELNDRTAKVIKEFSR